VADECVPRKGLVCERHSESECDTLKEQGVCIWDKRALRCKTPAGRALFQKLRARADQSPPSVEPASVEPPSVEPASVEPASVEPASVEPARVEPSNRLLDERGRLEPWLLVYLERVRNRYEMSAYAAKAKGASAADEKPAERPPSPDGPPADLSKRFRRTWGQLIDGRKGADDLFGSWRDNLHDTRLEVPGLSNGDELTPERLRSDFDLVRVVGDGSCMWTSIALGLRAHGVSVTPDRIRADVANAMRQNRQTLEEVYSGDLRSSHGVGGAKTFDELLKKVRDDPTFWGDRNMMCVAAQIYNFTPVVLMRTRPSRGSHGYMYEVQADTTPSLSRCRGLAPYPPLEEDSKRRIYFRFISPHYDLLLPRAS
jgi:hypothetical protein